MFNFEDFATVKKFFWKINEVEGDKLVKLFVSFFFEHWPIESWKPFEFLLSQMAQTKSETCNKYVSFNVYDSCK